MSHRLRADRLLVARGLFDSRAKAQAAIAAGHVSADGAPVRKPSDEIPEDARLNATPAQPYVSRGGVKLAAALDAGAVDVAGSVCLDVGASTGGFTQALLDRGAACVYAVDVGRDQLHPSLSTDPRVISYESMDVRKLGPSAFTEPPSLVVVDVSFISLKLVLPAALALAAPDCRLVALIKPQFEVGRELAQKNKGIVRDPAVHVAVCDAIASFVGTLGCIVEAMLTSPITGGDGNREFLLVAHRIMP
jgi:23S rRNA (cytidine1920-2'-O)/16S rRNA (cytidine1409-2'-O)-methyltransferase